MLSGELVANTPAAKSWNGIMLLMPGVTGDPNTVQLTPGMVLFGIHGGPTTEGRLQVDGMNVGASRGGGGVSGYSVDTANVQEISFRTSGGLGEAETGGPLMNIVPKTGGNTFRGSSSFQSPNSSFQSDNYDDNLRSRLSAPSKMLRLWDVDFALGGPIKKDKLWFFYLGRSYGNGTSVTGMFANANVGNPNPGRTRADKSLQARNDNSTMANGLRAHVANQPEEQAEPLLGRAARVQRRAVDRDDGVRLPPDARRLDHGRNGDAGPGDRRVRRRRRTASGRRRM